MAALLFFQLVAASIAHASAFSCVTASPAAMSPPANHAIRAPAPVVMALGELKAQLLEALDTVPLRGTAPDSVAGYDGRLPPYIAQVLDLVNDLEPYDPAAVSYTHLTLPTKA